MNDKNPIKLTIGMAHYEDFNGVYFTVQALRMYHSRHLKNVQLIVVDNSPGTSESEMVQKLLGNVKPGLASVKYVELSNAAGTSVSRQTIFDHADGEAVLVMDCHVMLEVGAIDKLIELYDNNPDSKDIFSGPLMYDNLVAHSTHFDPVWRSEMWGVWGVAWQCKCSENGSRFSVTQIPDPANPDRNLTRPVELNLESKGIMACKCGNQIPTRVAWEGHEQAYIAAGHKRIGQSPTDAPFEIPGMGLGIFSCRRDAWPGFNPDALGFGGEELYIHEKFRRQGGKAICLPWLRWLHRFGRPGGAKYPLTRWLKVRNYVLEFNELGWDLAPIREHFVDSGKMSTKEWEALVADPVKLIEPPAGCRTCNQKRQEAAAAEFNNITSVSQAFLEVVKIPRDIDQHMAHLRALVTKCPRVTEFTYRRESTIAFLAGKPEELTSYQMERDGILAQLGSLGIAGYRSIAKTSTDVSAIAETDLLFLDTEHTYDRLSDELRKYAKSVTRFIVVHDTQLYGEQGGDGGKGKLVALRDFMRDNPEWSVISHTTEQYGLTVIGCRAEDKPKLPGKLQMAKNFGKALKDHVADGLGKTSEALFEQRLSACSMCSLRRDDRCTACGCFIEEKASWASSECPMGAWPMDEADTAPLPPQIITDAFEPRSIPKLEMTMEEDGKGGIRGKGQIVGSSEFPPPKK